MRALRLCALRLTVLAAATVGGLALAGCGFTPMYANADLGQSLADVEVVGPPHSRPGYLVRQAIYTELGADRSASPRYRVEFTLQEGRGPRGVRVNNVASRYEVTLTTTYLLRDMETGQPVTSGSFVTQTSYDSVDAPYAGLAASQEGEERAAQQVAVRLRLELSRFLTGHPYHQDPTLAGRQDRYRSVAGAPTLNTPQGDDEMGPIDPNTGRNPAVDAQATPPTDPDAPPRDLTPRDPL